MAISMSVAARGRPCVAALKRPRRQWQERQGHARAKKQQHGAGAWDSEIERVQKKVSGAIDGLVGDGRHFT